MSVGAKPGRAWHDSTRGWGTLLLGDPATPLEVLLEEAWDADFRFYYWLRLTESHGDAEDVFV